MSHPLVSVITPCFNAATTLPRALDSLLAQSYPHIELIVIDGGSADASPAILEQYRSRLAYCSSEPDRGIAHAFNKGIAVATGSLIGLLNADDWLEPGTIAAVAARHEQLPEAVIHGDMRYWLTPRRSLLAPPRPRISLEQLPYHPACFVPAILYARHGGFDESYRYAMDTDFLVRLYQAGVGFDYIAEVLANMSSGGVSTRQAAAPYRERREIYRRAGMNPLRNQWLYSVFVSRMYVRLMVEKFLLR